MPDERDFKDGCIEYSVTSEIPGNFSLEGWDDGYVAFSSGEKRLKDIQHMNFLDMIKDRVNDINGIEGYLMEVDLWRENDDGSYEEISIEREDRGFLVQLWKLSKAISDTDICNHCSYRCYYNREAKTSPRANSIFKDSSLKSIEVIVPEHRLHFFITCVQGR